MAIKFITGNKRKFEEINAVLGGELEQVQIDLPEIQEIDAKEIIRHKLLAAQEHEKGDYIVEDTSLYLECLGGKLPGPMIKWFEKVMGNDGIANLVGKLGNDKAEARVLIGLSTKSGGMHFFEGVVKGRIVQPRGDKDFGWGPIFEPEGKSKTFGEMEREEKHALSMRGIAARKLKEFLKQ